MPPTTPPTIALFFSLNPPPLVTGSAEGVGLILLLTKDEIEGGGVIVGVHNVVLKISDVIVEDIHSVVVLGTVSKSGKHIRVKQKRI